jgi:Mg2+-importing ATPase
MLVVTVLLPYLPFAGLFDFVALPFGVLAAVLAISVLYVGVTEWLKRHVYRL